MLKPTICTRQIAAAPSAAARSRGSRATIKKQPKNLEYESFVANNSWLELGKVPLGFWAIQQNHKKYLEWLFNHLGFKTMEDWYKLRVKDVRSNRGKTLLWRYKGSVSTMLMEVFSDFQWLPWKFDVVPHHYWDNMHNQRKYFDWLFKHLGFKDMTDWYSLRRYHVNETGGANLLHRTYSDSIPKALTTVYPEYAWDFSKFSRVPKSYWNQQTLGKLLTEVEQQLQITNLNDWYRISKEQLVSCGAHHIILQNGGLYEVLKKQYPHHPWMQSMFNNRSKRAAQRWMRIIVCQTFANQLNGVEVIEDYMHPELRFSNTNEPMQLDLFIPAWKLAFEYQGQQHYHDIQVFGPVRQYSDRDIDKKNTCAAKGITLITVPYWWDGKLASLASTIHAQRPDMQLEQKLHMTLNTPIPDSPHTLAKRFQNVGEAQDNLMLATDWDGFTSLAGWMVSEKYDGLRAFWDGESKLYNRAGKPIRVPAFWTDKLPKVKLDGELWMGHNSFSNINNLMRSKTPSRWEGVQFCVFDIVEDRVMPSFIRTNLKTLPFSERYKRLQELESVLPPYVRVVKQTICSTDEQVQAFLKEVLANGGEGIVARHCDSAYEAGRSPSFVRIKPMEAEVKFVQVHRQKEGLVCEQPNGKRCVISCPPEVMENPPKADTIITVRHYGLASSGKLRQPAYFRERHDISWNDVHWN